MWLVHQRLEQPQLEDQLQPPLRKYLQRHVEGDKSHNQHTLQMGMKYVQAIILGMLLFIIRHQGKVPLCLLDRGHFLLKFRNCS